ncbi:hypothetical protein GH714_000029 [Hevea brasiliensis]|uniref:Uncharacterized protein n=1 Tax=Hevea brasiliensis TaxID=3981 RepID=A0A6A6L9E2_HEVBR|nr:hypothetical protein GH714_000029 [Hevea brasiliensis]
MRSILEILVSEHQDPEVSQDPTIAELIKLARKAKQNMAIENPRLQNLEQQMQSQNQKIQDLSAWLHRMEEMMSHRMEEMMSQMMELVKASQGKGKEPMVPETQSNVNGTRVNPIEIGANSNEGRGILPLPKGKENGDSGNSSQGHKSSCNLRNSAMKLKHLINGVHG